jgi:hypothetical protein
VGRARRALGCVGSGLVSGERRVSTRRRGAVGLGGARFSPVGRVGARHRAVRLAKRAALFAVPPVALSLPSGLADAAKPLPRLLSKDFSGAFAVRPARIAPSPNGGDIIAGEAVSTSTNPGGAHRDLGRITWTSWTTTRAKGVGVLWENGCPKTCPNVRYFAQDVDIDVSRVRHGRFTRIRLTPTRYGGHLLLTLEWQSGSVGTGYFWDWANAPFSE